MQADLPLIDKTKIPSHVAIIMDGNGRWAKQRGKERIFGHENGVVAVREATEAAAELGVKFLTLYAFSTENWNRPKAEVEALMDLLVNTIYKELPTLMKNHIRLLTIGNMNSLPEQCKIQLTKAINETSRNEGLTLVVALSYSARWEIVEAVKKIAQKATTGEIAPEMIDEQLFSKYLSTGGIPDPELLIRTSGEQRISNFLLWQCAYTEFYFTPTLWPDFRKQHFYEAINDFQKRERRFGKTSEQLSI